MSSDGLKKIYLIKSAGYEFNEIDLKDNTLLLGESGVGKTTIMRAVLFFYTMDYSDAILNLTSDTKKSFNDWYFKEHNSHLVYQYTKANSKFLFVVSKSGKLNYSFIDMTNSTFEVKDLFIEENRAVSLEKLNEKIQKANLPNYHTSIKDRYINTFHKRDVNTKKIKHESIVDFSLFESVKSTREYAKTLSNIFMASKVNSTSIKKSIVSLIDNSEIKIDLNEIKLNLDEYVKHKDEIEKFEKKIPNIENLSEKYNNYHKSKNEFKQKANELEAIRNIVAQKTQELKLKIDKLQEEQVTLSKNNDIEMSKIDDKIENSSTEVIELGKELRELKEKVKEYEFKKIDTLVDEYKKEREYKNQLETNNEKYIALTSKFEGIKEKYLKIQERLKSSSDEQILDLKNENVEFNKNVVLKKQTILEEKESKIDIETQIYVDDIVELEANLKGKESEFNAISVKLGEIKHFTFNKETIAKYEDEIGQYEKAILDNQRLLNDNSFEIKKVEQELDEIAKSLKESSQKLDQEIKDKKDELFKQKSLAEQKLDFDRDNLYGYINRNSIKNANKLVTYLKDEILFSQKRFTIKEDANSNSIFGLNVEFEEEFENSYEQSKLQKELKLIKESIKQLNRDAIRRKNSLENEASRVTKEKNRLRSLYYKKKDELEENKRSYDKNQTLAKLNLQKAISDAAELKKLKNEELQKAYSMCKIAKEELNSKILKNKQNIERISISINSDITTKIKQYDEELKQSKNILDTKIQNIKNKCNEKIENSQNELNEALKNNGVDSELLKSISAEIKELKVKLESIEEFKSLVIIYLKEYKDKIATIPTLKENLESSKTYLNDLKEKKSEIKNIFDLKYTELQSNKNTLIAKQNNIDEFTNSYFMQIAKQDIQKAIKNVLTLDSKPIDENVEISSILVDRIVELHKNILSSQDSIESSVMKIVKNMNIDNLFKISIPTDYIEDKSYLKTANELIEYIKNDKLSLLKDASLDKFKSNIVLIKKQLGSFEEALADINSEVNSLGNSIRKATDSFRVIDSIRIKFSETNNNTLNTLKELSDFYDKNNDKFLSGLFDSLGDDKSSVKLREDLRDKIVELVELLNVSKEYLELEDGFVLEFRVVERGNDLKWRQTLNDIGSNGTSTLVKSIINISMLKMVSKNIVKDSSIVSHCILDEIGTISTEYFRELKEFVNKSGFVFLNGMPTEDDILMSMYPTIYVGQNFGDYSKMILASRVDI
jgi:chromosome segregation ATPase